MKSSVEQIRARFDADVERFSNLETGQTATMDAALCMALVTAAAAAVTPAARDLLDIGCGAGNFTVKMLARLSDNAAGGGPVNCTLVDLSLPMVERARQRVAAATRGRVTTVQQDMRAMAMGEAAFDIVLAASTLHHLRGDEEWHAVFGKIHRALRPGGSFWIFDLITHDSPAIDALQQARYAEYLRQLKGGGAEGEAYQKKVFAYVAEEDTPRSLGFQVKLLEAAGFVEVEVLHKNGPFAAFGGRKRV